jgi:hypothetical protein
MTFVIYSLIENLRNPEYRRNQDWYKKQPEAVRKQLDLMDEVVRQKIGYLFVYADRKVNDPVAGKFELIDQSKLRELVKGIADAEKKDAGKDAGPGPGQGGGNLGGGNLGGNPGGAAPGAADAAKRDSWSPIGEIAPATLGGGAAAPGGNRPFGFGGGQGGLGAPPPPKGGKEFIPKGGLGGLGQPPGAIGPEKDKKGAHPAAGLNLQPRTEFIVLFVWREPGPSLNPAATEEKK